MNAPEMKIPRLTGLAHGGGCGCKLAPGVLESILANTAKSFVPKELLVGIETSDDAAVYRINETHRSSPPFLACALHEGRSASHTRYGPGTPPAPTAADAAAA